MNDMFLDDIKKEDKVYLLVAHNGISRAIESYVRDMSNEEFAGFGIKNCELRKYEFFHSQGASFLRQLKIYPANLLFTFLKYGDSKS